MLNMDMLIKSFIYKFLISVRIKPLVVIRENMLDKSVFKMTTSNLPVYIYDLDADVALVFNRQAYKIKGYDFSRIRIVTNQAIRPGDCILSSACYFGNEHTTIIDHLKKKEYLSSKNQRTIEIEDSYGCRIDQLSLGFSDGSIYSTCGDGSCTVFLELSDAYITRRIRQLVEREDKLNVVERMELDNLKKETLQDKNIQYWKERLAPWDERFENIGEVPENLVY